ncbi:MAG: sugar phosphate isomerase/epimerase [Acidobacteria bacterium]|nr:sugar phosphate isomerase/epimerase [Acidobacteriota bacterium]
MRESLVSRRALLAGGAAFLIPSYAAARTKLKVAIFSKHLQFLQGEDLAKGAVEIGFDAIDLTVRKGGHVEPANVARDLPPLAGIIRKHGLEVSMVTTDIGDAETPYAEDVLKTASALGIRHYRSGGFKWADGVPLETQIEGFRTRLAKLTALNQRYGMCAMYHTHSGVGQVGASIWDLHEIMRGLDPKAMGINYDVGHATIEGGLGGWIASFRICGSHLRGIAVKDFVWAKDAKGSWRERWCPIGEGMVKLDQFFKMVAASDFDGPVQVHFEYPLGGANNGSRSITMTREEVFAQMKKDLARTRASMAQAGL